MQITSNITASRNCTLQQFCNFFVFFTTRRVKTTPCIGVFVALISGECSAVPLILVHVCNKRFLSFRRNCQHSPGLVSKAEILFARILIPTSRGRSLGQRAKIIRFALFSHRAVRVQILLHRYITQCQRNAFVLYPQGYGIDFLQPCHDKGSLKSREIRENLFFGGLFTRILAAKPLYWNPQLFKFL